MAMSMSLVLSFFLGSWWGFSWMIFSVFRSSFFVVISFLKPLSVSISVVYYFSLVLSLFSPHARLFIWFVTLS
jgi:glycosyltransferase involved in cell wall biosynthesis